MVRQLNQVPVSADPYVHGIRVGELGGVYMVTSSVPPQIESNPVITLAEVGSPTQHTTGFASGTPQPTITLETWKVDGITVGTGASYTPVVADYGKQLTVTETWTNTGGSTDAVSAPVLIENELPDAEWDFMGGVLPPGLTFARASLAWYYDASGNYVSAANNVPRFTYDPVSLELLGYYAEQTRTNRVFYSMDYTNVIWVKDDCTIQTAAGTAPDGTNTAMAMVESGPAPVLRQSDIPGFTAATGTAVSVFLRYDGENQWVRINFGSGTLVTDGGDVWIDILNGVVGSTAVIGTGSFVSVTIQPSSHGFFRVCMVTNATPGTTRTFMIRSAEADLSFSPAPVGRFLVWGVQAENNAPNVSSFLPTTSVITVRQADNCFIDGAGFLDFFNQNQGAFVNELELINQPLANCTVGTISDTTVGNRIAQFQNTLNAGTVVVQGGTTMSPSLVGPIPSYGVPYRFGNTYKVGEVLQAIGGTVSNAGASTALTVPLGYTRLNIGGDYAGINGCGGAIKNFSYWATYKTAAELSALTQG